MKIAFLTPFIWTNGVNSGVPTVHRTITEWSKHAEVVALVPGQDRRTVWMDGAQVRVFPFLFWRRFGHFDETKSLLTLELSLPRFLRLVANKLIMLQYMAQTACEGVRVGLEWRPDIWYGVTPYAFPAAQFSRLVCGGRVVTRLLGTFLGPLCATVTGVGGRLKRIGFILKRLPEILAFRFGGDLLVITDDGTQGRQVADLIGTRNAHCLRNGVDLPVPPTEAEREAARARLRCELGIPHGHIVALYTGQLIGWKRLDRLIRACKDVKHNFVRPVTFVIVGDGTDRQALESLVSRLELEMDFRFVGAVTREQISAYLLAAQIFVAPHDYSCACNTTIEAMSYGIPIVATSFGDTQGLILDEVEGLLGDETYKRTFASALVLAVNGGNSLNELGRRARERVEREVGSWEARIAVEIELVMGVVRVAVESRESAERAARKALANK